MSRGFFGGGGLGSGKNPFAKKATSGAASYSKKRKFSTQEMVESRSTHKVKTGKEILEEKMADMMFRPDKKSYSNFQLPGTGGGEEGQALSKGHIEAMEMAKQKYLKKMQKKRENAVKIQPKAFGGAHGGRIGENGKVTNNKGQVVLTVDPDTGIIKDAMGAKVGKYQPFAFGNDQKIEKLIAKYSSKTDMHGKKI